MVFLTPCSAAGGSLSILMAPIPATPVLFVPLFVHARACFVISIIAGWPEWDNDDTDEDAEEVDDISEEDAPGVFFETVDVLPLIPEQNDPTCLFFLKEAFRPSV